MKRLFSLVVAAILIGGTLVLSQRVQAPDEMGRAAATKLFESLTPLQKKTAVRGWDDKDRGIIRFATEGTGIPINLLSEAQKMLVDDLFRSMLSDFGLKRCLEMEGKGRVTFFGEPSQDGRFACRIDKNNHLTLIHTEYGKDPGGDFGPIVLGAKGAGESLVWIEEDQLALELAAALNSEEAKIIKTKGLPIGDLSEKARPVARKLLEQRLAIFSAPGRKILDDAIRQEGGVDKLSIALWGNATKSNADGGIYHWNIVGGSFRCNWQSDGKSHPHMTLKAKRPG